MSETQVVGGDLLDQRVDAIVNAWNRNFIPWWLLLPQGVSGAIKRRGGYAPFRELRRFGILRHGDQQGPDRRLLDPDRPGDPGRGDSYGYAILQRVRELSGGRMEWTDGMLYPVLHRLERLGHVEARWEVAESGRRRKYYRITSRGRAQLAEERRQWQAVDARCGASGGALPSMPAAAPGRATSTGSLSDADPHDASLEEQIDQWRSYLRRRQAIHSVDVAELEDHLREQVAACGRGARHRRGVPGGGEAHGRPRRPLAGVRARALGPPLEAARRRRPEPGEPRRGRRTGCHRRLLPGRGGGRGSSSCRRSSGWTWTRTPASTPATRVLRAAAADRLLRWKRRLDAARSAGWPRRSSRRRCSPTSIPFPPRAHTEALTALHLPIALWLVVGIAYAGGRWSQVAAAWTSSASRASCSSTTC
jgi:PadR family transcriptional regulator, regulatory protein PadR